MFRATLETYGLKINLQYIQKNTYGIRDLASLLNTKRMFEDAMGSTFLL